MQVKLKIKLINYERKKINNKREIFDTYLLRTIKSLKAKINELADKLNGGGKQAGMLFGYYGENMDSETHGIISVGTIISDGQPTQYPVFLTRYKDNSSYYYTLMFIENLEYHREFIDNLGIPIVGEGSGEPYDDYVFPLQYTPELGYHFDKSKQIYQYNDVFVASYAMTDSSIFHENSLRKMLNSTPIIFSNSFYGNF